MTVRLVGKVAWAARWFVHEAGIRFLMRRKAAAIVAIATMALALGANTAVFAVLKAFLLSSFALPDADRLYVIGSMRDLPGRGAVLFNDAWPNYQLLRQTQRTFSDVTAFVQSTASWDDRGEVRPLQASRTTASFFTTARVRPVLGTTFAASDEGVSPSPLVVISHALWRGALSADPKVIGRSLIINGAPHTVVGVMPEGFTHPLPTDIWLPMSLPERQLTAITGARVLNVYGRLRDDVSYAQAAGEMAAFTNRALEASKDNRDFRYELRTIRESLLPGVDRTVILVQASALVLLLLAVLNLTSLLIAWGFDRRQEMAVRLALGARSSRVTRMTVLQSVVVVAVGGLGGVLLAAAALIGLRSLELTQAIALFFANLRLDLQVALWSTGTALVAAVLAGAVPSWFNRRVELAAALRASSRGASLSREALRWQKAMVVVQSALSVVILSAAALVVVSFRNLKQIPTGFATGDRMIARVQFSGDVYAEHPKRAAFATRLLENVALERALTDVGFSTTLPVGDTRFGARYFPELADGSLAAEPLLAHYRRVSPGYLEGMGIPLLRGRGITAQDDAEHPFVVVVSRAMANRFWPGENPIGKRVYRASAAGKPVLNEVIGVAGDVRDAGNAAPPGETVYVPFAQTSLGQMSLVFRSRGSPASAIVAMRRALRATDPSLALSGIASLESLAAQADSLPRIRTILILVFATVAVAIAMLGSYGVMSQLVANREREFALRLVFGARPNAIGTSVMVQASRLALPGVMLGAVAVWFSSGLLQPFVFNVDPHSLTLTAMVAVGMLGIVGISALAPALRATRIDVRKGGIMS